MRSGKCITGLLLWLVVLFASTLGEPREIVNKTAWVGEEVDLECGDGGTDSANRLWKKGDDVVAVGYLDLITHDRIRPVNSSAILRIVNVTLDDQGQYTCTVYSTPKYTHNIRLHVKEVPCEAPKHPINGGYVNESVGDDGLYKANDKIRFYCDSGFELIGEAKQTCNGSLNRWSAEEPYCEPKYISELKRRLDTFEDKFTTMDTNWTLLMMWLSMSVRNPLPRPLKMTIDNVKKRLETAGEIGTLTQRDGRTASEFTWIVKNIEEKIDESYQNESYMIRSPPFYTNVPGYRLQLRLNPEKSNSTHFGMYMGVVQGEFDSVVPWPFKNKYEVMSLSGGGSAMDHFSVEPSDLATSMACAKVFLQPSSNSKACGTSEFIKRESWLSNKNQYLIDGSLTIKVTVWVNH